MKKLLTVLFSLFFLISPSVFADDISDFQIEGMSIGDSLLDYMTEDEILEEIEITKDYYLHLNEPYKYAEVYFLKDLKTYSAIAFLVKNNQTNKYISNKDEKYTILSIRGRINYIEDFDGCLQKRNEISEVISKMFLNVTKSKEISTYNADPSGDSIFDSVFFEFDSGDQIDAYCTNLEETFRIKKKWGEGLSVFITSFEVGNWLLDYK